MKTMRTEYEIIEAKQQKAPPRNLIRISGDKELITSLKAFGPNYFNNNVSEMQKSYSHPQTGEIITFREPATVESILAASYDFRNRAKPQIFDPGWLQAGRIARTSEGVFVNPPKDEKGKPIINKKVLKNYLNMVKPLKVNKGKIYVVSDSENLRDFGFADYDSFVRGVQDCDTFSQGGLARVLEHTEDEAKNLRIIASPKFYKKGVNVFGFDEVKKPVLRIVGLCSCRFLGDLRLNVYGLIWYDYYLGYAFGVLETGEASAHENK